MPIKNMFIFLAMIAFFNSAVLAKENKALNFSDCMNQLAKSLNGASGPSNVVNSPMVGRLIFYKGTDVDGKPAGRGFIQLTTSGARYCQLNWVAGQQNKFKIDGQEVQFGGGSSSTSIGEAKCGAVNKNLNQHLANTVGSYIDRIVDQNPKASRKDIQKQLGSVCGDQSHHIQRALDAKSSSGSDDPKNPTTPANTDS